MWLKLRRTVTAILLLGSALLLMGSTPGCGGHDGSITVPAVLDRATSWPVWLPDGSAILFSRYTYGTFVVDVAGTRLQKIPRTTSVGNTVPGNMPRNVPGNRHNFGYMFATLSPDGSRVAFVGMAGVFPTIRTADLEGMDVIRFAHASNSLTNLYPVWSPNGSRIAHLSDWSLTIVDSDGLNRRMIVQAESSHPPRWSPDGNWIAFIAGSNPPQEGEVTEWDLGARRLALVRPDGSDLMRLEAIAGVSHENQEEHAIAKRGLTVLGSVISMPAWSPDGSQIAFFQVEKGSVALYTIVFASALAEGPIEARKLLSIDGDSLPSSLGGSELLYTTLSWSPDGTEILFTSGHTQGHVVSVVDGSVLADIEPGWAEWSPDGARIAVVTSRSVHFAKNGKDYDPAMRDVLYTIARDGTDKRVLVRGNLEQFVAAGSGE